MLVDTGVLIALLDRRDPNHQRCVTTAQQLPNAPLITTWCCLTEAMYFMGKIGGFTAQQGLWTLLLSKRILLQTPNETRMAELMEKYQDTPMDLADASLVALAEELETTQIFTLDSDFYVYRTSRGEAFQCLP
jgi:uncharacterized protein